jgi:hypothetical protein
MNGSPPETLKARGAFGPPVEFRAARRADRRATAAFLRREDPEDYALEWMDRLLSVGKFYLLLDGDRIAGLVHVGRGPDGSAWISAERIGRQYRGHGWINRLNAYALASRPLRSAPATRMLITHDNASSIRAATKGGFRVVSTLSFMDWQERSKRKRRARAPSGFAKVSAPGFLRAARGSRVLKEQAGLAYMSFNGAFAVNPRSVRACRPWLFSSPTQGPIMACTFPDIGERWMAVQPFRANATVAARLIDFAREQSAASMTAILPANARARRAFSAAGFTNSSWARRVFIFEKRRPAGGWGVTSSRAAAVPRTPRR